MKKFLIISIWIFFNKINAQVVFCPRGAEWHYLFNLAFSSSQFNESVKYIGDSIDGVDTLKILSHRRFFIECNNIAPAKTLIKQNGDTVFFKNKLTQNTWQILYNFAALPGDSWNTFILLSDSSIANFSYVVTSVQQVTTNGFNLKTLNVNANMGVYTVSLNISERYGSSGFLFNYRDYDAAWCDADFFAGRLCYQDSSFGIKQFSSMPCDYSTAAYAGLEEKKINNSIKLYPNPAKDFLNVESNLIGETQIDFIDIYGGEVKRVKLEQNNKIDLNNLSQGIYMLFILKNNETLYKTKLIKE